MARRSMFRSHDLANIPDEVTDCLVLGARLYKGGLPPILRLRLQVMEDIYRRRPDTVFTVSGDVEDTEAMVRHLDARGVVPRHAVIAHAEGKNTLTSIAGMHRKGEGRPFVILTSSFHLPRCVFIADAIGADAYPFRISDYESRFSFRYVPRELIALLKAFCLLKVIPCIQGGGHAA